MRKRPPEASDAGRRDPHPRVSVTRIRALGPLYAIVFVGFLGYSLMITVFTPMILRNDNGMLPSSSSPATRSIVLGFLVFLYPLGQFVGAPVLGAVSDRLGRRPVLLGSLAASTVWYGVIGAALVTRSLPLLMSACFLAGLGEANISLAQSSIADLVPASDRNRFFGYVYLSSSLAYVVGPLGGGQLANPQLASWFGYPTPFFVVDALLALTLLGVWLLYPESHRATGQAGGGYLKSFTNLATVITDRRLRPLYLVNFLLYLAIFGFFRIYPMYLVRVFHLDVARESLFVAWVAVPIVVANLWLVGRLSRTMVGDGSHRGLRNGRRAVAHRPPVSRHPQPAVADPWTNGTGGRGVSSLVRHDAVAVGGRCGTRTCHGEQSVPSGGGRSAVRSGRGAGGGRPDRSALRPLRSRRPAGSRPLMASHNRGAGGGPARVAAGQAIRHAGGRRST